MGLHVAVSVSCPNHVPLFADPPCSLRYLHTDMQVFFVPMVLSYVSACQYLKADKRLVISRDVMSRRAVQNRILGQNLPSQKFG